MNTQQNKLALHISSKQQLAAAYMPYIKNGGLFVKTNQRYEFGSEILFNLMLFSASIDIKGKVIWLAESGIGIQFSADNIGKELRAKIENYLTGIIDAHRFTLPS